MRPIQNYRLMGLAIAALAAAGLACNIGQTGPEDATSLPAQGQVSPDTET